MTEKKPLEREYEERGREGDIGGFGPGMTARDQS